MKITRNELKKLIMEEVSRIQKTKSLEAKKAEIEKELKALNESVSVVQEDEMDLIPAPVMEEEVAAAPAAAPAATPDVATLEREFLPQIKLDPKAITMLSNDPSMMEEGVMDFLKSIVSKKDAAKKSGPAAAQAAGMKTAEDFKDPNKLKNFVAVVMEKAGLGSALAGLGTYASIAVSAAIKGAVVGLAATPGLNFAVLAMVAAGFVAMTVGAMMKTANNVKAKKGAVK